MHFFHLKRSVLLFTLLVYGNFAYAVQELSPTDSLQRKNIDINNRIARHFLEREPNLAFYYADSAAVVALHQQYPQGLFEALSTKGKVAVIRGDFQQALSYLHKCRKIASSLKDSVWQIKNNIALASTYLLMEDFNTAKHHYNRALDFDMIVNHPVMHAKATTGLWQLYWHLNERDTLLYFQKNALDIYEHHKMDRDISQQIANAFLQVKNFDQALAYYVSSLNQQLEAGDQKAIADDMMNIGEIYLSKALGDLSLEYFQKAERIYLKSKSKSDLFNVGLSIAKVCLKEGLYDKAKVKLNECIDLARQLNSKLLESQAVMWQAKVYEEAREYASAIQYHKRFVALKDSIYGEEQNRKIAEIKANFEFEQKEQEVASLIKEKEQLNQNARYQQQIYQLNSNLLFILAISTLLVILVTILIFYRYRAKKQANKLLERQFLEISNQKAEIEAKSEIIKENNLELKRAREEIENKNDALKESNQQLGSLVDQRTTELKRTYNKLSFHINNTPLAVLEWNDKMELIRWSNQAEKIFGWKAEEMIGKQIQDLPLNKKDHQDSIDKIFAELLTGEKPRNFYQNKNYHKDGSLLDVEWSNSIRFNEKGRLESILSIANDVTLRETAIQELKNSNNELDNFIYRASHDLRGPITRLVGIVNLGMLEAKEEVSRKYFDLLGKVAFEMNAMLSRLLTVHEIDHHEYKLEEIALKDEIRGHVEEIRNKNLTFKFDLTYDIAANIKLKTDKKLLKIAVQNLIENAYVHSNDLDPKIVIKTRKINKYFIKITFSDNGVGFSEEVVDKIFTMFFQGSEKTKLSYGLGLFLSKRAVEKLGGNIALVRPVNDTVFELIMPNLQTAALQQKVLQLAE